MNHIWHFGSYMIIYAFIWFYKWQMVTYESYMTVSKIDESHINHIWHLGPDIVTYGSMWLFKALMVTYKLLNYIIFRNETLLLMF